LRYFICLTLIFLVSLPCLSFAHPGKTDQNGCHTDRKRGFYHCHNGPNVGNFFSKDVETESSTSKETASKSVSKKLLKGIHTGKVVGILDGDTLMLLVNKTFHKIRLAEIDTPDKGQPFGNKAKQILSELVLGKNIIVDVHTIDRYGRAVARAYVNNLGVCAEMVRQGAAWVYREDVKDESLFELESEAKKAKRGLWALLEAEKIPPWEWP
jgi:endonuclease YncB( thermonuclease family)